MSDKPFLIAEVSGNHGGNLDQMLRLISEAVKCGADAVKFQYFNPEAMVVNSRENDYVIQSGTWRGRALIDIYREGAVPKEWLDKLFSFASLNNIQLFSSTFDLESLRDLEEYNCSIYKIASNELEDLRLVDAVLDTNKQVILSTGVADEQLLDIILNKLSSAKKRNVTVLHCISEYPAPIKNSNLRTIPAIEKKYGVKVGLSDHSIGHITACGAVCLGATTIEKHFTLDRNDGALDSSFSATPDEFITLRKYLDQTFESLGKPNHGMKNYKNDTNIFTRQIWIKESVKAGHILRSTDLITYRTPQSANGILARNIYNIIGRKLKVGLTQSTLLLWENIE